MSNRKNNLSSLLGQVSRLKIDGQTTNTLLSPTNIVNQAQPKSSEGTKPPSLGDTKSSSFSARAVPTGINFGSPSNSRTSTQQSSSVLGNLLKQTASGGIASTFSGGFASIAGLGGLISGIASLFGGGGKSTPPPLVEFQLPSSQSQTVYVGSNGNTTYQGNAVESSGAGTSGTGIYPRPGSAGVSTAGAGSQSLQYQSAQIAQAVKTALLNSSSLNDVIAEI